MSKLDSLLSEIDPEDYVSYLGLDYKNTVGSSGPQLNVRECPRCGGSDWKVFLNAESGVGCCFHGSCSDSPGMNLFSLTKALNDGSNRLAFEELERYAKDIGWKPTRAKAVEQIAPVQASLVLPESVRLPHKSKIPKYLKGRKFEPKTIEHFGWLYSQSGKFYFKNAEDETRWQDYSKRIIIPVLDLGGELKTFQGRDITGSADKKYLFPAGLPGTARYLYNAHNAKSFKSIVMGEGVMDVAAIHQAFSADHSLAKVIPVGSFGKVLSKGQPDGSDQLGALLKLKQLGLKQITMMWDSEPKTVISAIKTAQELEALGFVAKVAILPEGCDPNEAQPHEVRSAYRNAFRATKLNCARYLARAK